MKPTNTAYNNKSTKRTLHEVFSRDQKRYFKKITKIYIKYHEAYNSKRTLFIIIKLLYYTVRRNILSPKRNIWLLGSFGCDLKICHANIVVARGAKLGNNIILHGNNCIGVKSENDIRGPQIGNNVDIGYGAAIIGDVRIANDVKIGAGSVVVKDIPEEGAIYAGNPARRIK